LKTLIELFEPTFYSWKHVNDCGALHAYGSVVKVPRPSPLEERRLQNTSRECWNNFEIYYNTWEEPYFQENNFYLSKLKFCLNSNWGYSPVTGYLDVANIWPWLDSKKNMQEGKHIQTALFLMNKILNLPINLGLIWIAKATKNHSLVILFRKMILVLTDGVMVGWIPSIDNGRMAEPDIPLRHFPQLWQLLHCRPSKHWQYVTKMIGSISILGFSEHTKK
jgi:hypothetical protein